jgi:hypothetical protein
MSYNIYENQNTKAFYTMSWLAFIISAAGIAAGLVYLEADFAIKGFIGMSYLFSITACFTLAKVIRDKHEAEKFINKVESAKTEKFLSETKGVMA